MSPLLTGILIGLAGFIVLALILAVAFSWGRRRRAAAERRAADKPSRIPTSFTPVPRGSVAQTRFKVVSPTRKERRQRN